MKQILPIPLIQALDQMSPRDNFITSSQLVTQQHEVFIDSDIEEPAKYRELVSLLFNASEGDVINIYVNCDGGNVDAALAIVEGLKNTKGQVTAHLIGACHSAASIISMYCHNVAVYDNAYSMIHTASFGTAGNTGNVKAHTEFTVRQIERLLNETYEGFLTKDELVKVKSGVELWFDADEIRARMVSRVKHLIALMKKKQKELDNEQ